MEFVKLLYSPYLKMVKDFSCYESLPNGCNAQISLCAMSLNSSQVSFTNIWVNIITLFDEQSWHIRRFSGILGRLYVSDSIIILWVVAHNFAPAWRCFSFLGLNIRRHQS